MILGDRVYIRPKEDPNVPGEYIYASVVKDIEDTRVILAEMDES